uniref:Protein CNPPD1 n=1 Tax=Alona affinis TaxID=381656 RepID=A0A9N6ZEG0_9CRUS|nr:EOG090X069C [Alona affinis]
MRPRNVASRASAHPLPQVMDYAALSERIKKTLYYGSLPELSEDGAEFSHSLTSVVVESFGQNDNNLFLEKLCFDYAADLSREACLSPCSLVLALIYLERLCDKNPNFVSSIPSSKLFLISVMMASKFLNDDGEEDEVINAEWANSAKLELAELNQLERQFLQAIDWALFVDDEDFTTALGRIERRVAQRESLKRGWLTYTDLDVLARTQLLVDTWHLVHSLVVNVSIACMTAYLASLVTLVGSALVVSSMPWNTSNPPTTSLSPMRLDPTSSSSNASTALPIAEVDPDLDDLSDLTLSLDLPKAFMELPGKILSISASYLGELDLLFDTLKSATFES